MKHEREKNQKLLREYLDLAEHQVFQTANQGGDPKNIYATQKAYAPEEKSHSMLHQCPRYRLVIIRKISDRNYDAEAAREFDQKSSG